MTAEPMSGDFERDLTRRAWTDDAFAAKIEHDPADALADIGLEVPSGIKLKVVIQRRDRVYFTIPPLRPPHLPKPPEPLNQFDLWSSEGVFIWIAPVAAKFKLLALRSLARRTSEPS